MDSEDIYRISHILATQAFARKEKKKMKALMKDDDDD